MIETIYLAGGCFWGLEELFRKQPGIINTQVGYCGGSNEDPTYENHPGHAETLAISYDTHQTSYANLLDFFFRVHDPTTPNRQGYDIGTSYRSTIFYQTKNQLDTAKKIIEKVNRSKLYNNPVATTLESYKHFYPAEEYHQKYLLKNPQGYTCHFLRSTKSIL